VYKTALTHDRRNIGHQAVRAEQLIIFSVTTVFSVFTFKMLKISHKNQTALEYQMVVEYC